ncbi:ORF6N domain-containing protein [Butyrivibrio fibrisolvens]|uniref:ORF6N domain-containing protein n=1 Tax=Butyrivibrio fibrisolvens TaxID=831 RepID=UPI0003B6A145|nr:ORF6N domain-containing protein [Butyrivibrio fibrisolvens]
MEDTTEIITLESIRKCVYIIRGQQVMLDSDLAAIYGYEVKRLNEQVKRNIRRFPEDFMFQIEPEELPERLKSQIATLNESGNKRGLHIKKMPYAFTEQGIYMLATVLRGELAEQQSIFIMRAFKEMRHFIANNALMFEKINAIELKQLEYQKSSDEKFNKIFEYMAEHEESNQKIFFDGQIFDAFSLLTDIIGQAKKEIILIDGYVDVITLNIIAKKKTGVNVFVYTLPSAKISVQDINNFNAQYPSLTVKKTTTFHDRFLIIDGTEGYHIGASLKDAGKKCFGINKIEGADVINSIIQKAVQTAK